MIVIKQLGQHRWLEPGENEGHAKLRIKDRPEGGEQPAWMCALCSSCS